MSTTPTLPSQNYDAHAWRDKGDRLKELEAALELRVPADSAYVVRLDGASFHTFTRGMRRPFDARLTHVMDATAADLLLHFHPVTAYTQSDEISLLFARCDPTLDGSTHLYNGRVQKLCSIVAAYATQRFNAHLAAHDWQTASDPDTLRDKVLGKGAWFDARVIPVTDQQAVECFEWRHVFDCRRNAVMTVAQHHFSPKELKGVNRRGAIDMLRVVGVNLADEQRFPPRVLNGCFIKRVRVERTSVDPRMGENVTALRTATVAFSQRKPITIDVLLAKYYEPAVKS